MRMPDEQAAGICGLFCGTCQAYPEYCHGCLSDLVAAPCAACSHGFRDCAQAHQVSHCYACADFPCQRLEAFSQEHSQNGICHHEHVIEDNYRMQEIGVAAWVAQQTAAHTCPQCGELILWFERDNHICRPTAPCEKAQEKS